MGEVISQIRNDGGLLSLQADSFIRSRLLIDFSLIKAHCGNWGLIIKVYHVLLLLIWFEILRFLVIRTALLRFFPLFEKWRGDIP